MASGADKLPANACNRVQQEQIWKDYVHHEENAVKVWRNTWGFLCDEYKKMTEDIKKQADLIEEEEEDEEEGSEGGEEGEEEEEEVLGDDDEKQEEKEVEEEKETLKLPPIHTHTQKVSKVPFLPPPCRSLPIKTSQEIGWRSARPECSLERFGTWGRPKKSILKHFNWSIYACP